MQDIFDTDRGKIPQNRQRPLEKTILPIFDKFIYLTMGIEKEKFKYSSNHYNNMKTLKDFLDLCEIDYSTKTKTKDFLDLFHKYLESIGIYQIISPKRLYEEMWCIGFPKMRSRANKKDAYFFEGISIKNVQISTAKPPVSSKIKELQDFVGICDKGMGLTSKTTDFLFVFLTYLYNMNVYRPISYQLLYKEMRKLGYTKRRVRANKQDYWVFDYILTKNQLPKPNIPKNKKTKKMGRKRKPLNVEEMRRLHKKGLSCREIAKKLGNISYSTISRRLRD